MENDLLEFNEYEHQFYNNWYREEFKRMTVLDSKLNIMITMISIIFISISYIIKNTFFNNFAITSLEGFFFLVCLIICILLILCSIFFLFRSIYNFEYAYLPDPEIIHQMIRDIEDFHNELEDEIEEKQENVDDDIENAICSLRFACIKNNNNVNDMRSGFLHKTLTFLILAIVSVFINFLFYYKISSNLSNEDNKTHKSNTVYKMKEIHYAN